MKFVRQFIDLTLNILHLGVLFSLFNGDHFKGLKEAGVHPEE